MYLLVVGHIHCAHDACHLRAERSKFHTNVSIIRNLLCFSAFPCIPVTRDGDQNGQSEKHHEDGRYVVLPPATAARNCLICTDLWRHRFRHWWRGSSGHWGGGH